MIHSLHLEKKNIQKIYRLGILRKPIEYFVWDDFIAPDIYAKIEKEIRENGYEILETHRDNIYRKNKSIALRGEKLGQLFDFFESQALEKYLALFLGTQVKKEFYIPREDIARVLGSDFTGAIAQVYERGDHFDWHIDGPLEQGSLGAFTYYLGGYGGEWEDSFGGNLEFGEKDAKGNIHSYESISYKKNTLVFICASEIAYHRVTPINTDIPRLSLQSTILKK